MASCRKLGQQESGGIAVALRAQKVLSAPIPNEPFFDSCYK
jgi:hypothetical protein